MSISSNKDWCDSGLLQMSENRIFTFDGNILMQMFLSVKHVAVLAIERNMTQLDGTVPTVALDVNHEHGESGYNCIQPPPYTRYPNEMEGDLIVFTINGRPVVCSPSCKTYDPENLSWIWVSPCKIYLLFWFRSSDWLAIVQYFGGEAWGLNPNMPCVKIASLLSLSYRHWQNICNCNVPGALLANAFNL